MPDTSEATAFEKIMAGLSGQDVSAKKKRPAVRKGAATVTMGATCTPAGQPMWSGGTRCPPKGAQTQAPAPKGAQTKTAPPKGILSSFFG